MSWLKDFLSTGVDAIFSPKHEFKKFHKKLAGSKTLQWMLPGQKQMLDVFANQVGIETPGKVEKKEAQQAALAAQRAIGPLPNMSGNLDLETGGVETAEQRKRRLRRLASIMESGDPYGALNLGSRGLLGG